MSELRRRWGLVLLTILGGFFTYESLVSDWLSLHIFVVPRDSRERTFGVERFFPWSLGFAIGAFLLVALVILTLLLPDRFRLALALVSVGLAALLALDLMLVAYQVEDMTRLAAQGAYQMREGLGDRYTVWLLVTSGGLQLAGSASLLLGLAAAQAPWPAWGPWIQVGFAGLLTVPALALPWERAWFYGDGAAASADYWLPLIGAGGAALSVGLLGALGLGVAAQLAPQRVRLVLALVAVLAAAVLVVALETYETSQIVKARYADRWIFIDGTMAQGLVSLAPVLCAFAAVRAWWRGRRPAAPSLPVAGSAGPGGAAPPSVAGSPSWPTGP